MVSKSMDSFVTLTKMSQLISSKRLYCSLSLSSRISGFGVDMTPARFILGYGTPLYDYIRRVGTHVPLLAKLYQKWFCVVSVYT